MPMTRVPYPVSAGAIASAIALAVANIDSPAELGLIAGSTNGELRLCYQSVAGANEWTLYAWDSASSTGASTPYRVDGTSGQWQAVTGKYHNGTASIGSDFTIAGGSQDMTGTGFAATAPLSIDLSRTGHTTASNRIRFRNSSGSNRFVVGQAGSSDDTTILWATANTSYLYAPTRLRISTGLAATDYLEVTASGVTQAGTGTLATGTGAVSLNGDTTVAGDKRLGVGGLSSSAAVTLGTISSVTGTSQRAVYINGYALNSGATSAGYGIMVNGLTTENASFTMAVMRAMDVSTMAKGASATVTAADAYHSAIQTVGATSNTGFHFGNGTVAAGTWGFYSSASSNNFLGTGTLYQHSTTDVANRVVGATSVSAEYQQNRANSTSIALNRFNAISAGGFFVFGKSRGTSVGSYTVVNSGDTLGEMTWNGADGTDMANAASMRVTVDGTPGAGDMPGKWWIATSADGAESPTDRLSVDSTGQVAVLATTDATSTTTGSIITGGGVGIAKALWVGGLVNIAGASVTTATTTQVGIGSTIASAVFNVSASSALTGTSQYAMRSGFTGSSGATVRIVGLGSEATTSASVFTCADLVQLGAISTITLGATSSVTNAIDLYTRARTIGTNNAAWYNGSATTASFTGNWCIYNQAGTANYLGSSATILSSPTPVTYVGAGASLSSPVLQVNGTGSNTASVGISRWSASAAGPNLVLAKSRSGTQGTFSIVSSGDSLGVLSWNGDDGVDFAEAATIRAVVDGTPGSNDMPAKLVFATAADGSASPTDRLSIDALGQVAVLATTDATSVTTGSLTTLGGISAAKYITVGGGTGATIRYVAGTANAAVATTLGSVGPTGATAGDPQGWMRVSINGTDRFIPYW